MKRIEITGTSVAANLTGFASNVTGAAFTLTANNSGDSLAHLVTVKNDSVTDHSGKTIALVGTGPNGQAQTETLTAPGTSATVTSSKHWLTLTSATPSATIGSDTFDIGWSAASVSAWVPVDARVNVFNVGFGCVVGTGSPTFTVQHTYDKGATAFPHAVVVSKTASTDGVYTSPVDAIRLSWAAAGQVTLSGTQATGRQ